MPTCASKWVVLEFAKKNLLLPPSNCLWLICDFINIWSHYIINVSDSCRGHLQAGAAVKVSGILSRLNDEEWWVGDRIECTRLMKIPPPLFGCLKSIPNNRFERNLKEAQFGVKRVSSTNKLELFIFLSLRKFNFHQKPVKYVVYLI